MTVSEGRWSCPRCSVTVVRSPHQDVKQWQTYLHNLQAAHGAVCSRKESLK